MCGGVLANDRTSVKCKLCGWLICDVCADTLLAVSLNGSNYIHNMIFVSLKREHNLSTILNIIKNGFES